MRGQIVEDAFTVLVFLVKGHRKKSLRHEWIYLNVVGRLTPSKNGNQEMHISSQLAHPNLNIRT
jgi:hypothetical protein